MGSEGRGGSAGGQGSEAVQTIINWVSNLKFRAKKISIIEVPFFKQGGLNNFGKFSIIEVPFTNRDPTL